MSKTKGGETTTDRARPTSRHSLLYEHKLQNTIVR